MIMNFNPKPVKQIWIEYRFNNTFMEASLGQADIQITQLVKSFDSFIMNEKENVMQSLTANTAKTKFGDLLMKVQREPIQINKNGSPVAVMMSCEEYEQLEAMKLMFVKSRFEQAEADALSGNLVDGNDFMNALDQGKFD